MKRVVVILLVILVLLVVADFALRSLAENSAAELIDEQIAQDVEPTVELGGFPFLRSVLTGTFDQITVEIPRASEGSLIVEDIELAFKDVQLEPLEVLAGRGTLRAESLSGRGVITEETLNDVISERQSDATVAIERDRVTLTVAGTTSSANVVVAANSLLLNDAGPLGAIEVPLPSLLSGVRFSSLRARPGELVLSVVGSRLRIRT